MVAVENRLERHLLGLENAGRAGEAHAFLAGDFRDRALGREIAAQDDQMAVLFDRVAKAGE